jgi:hypothetical protein
LPLVTTNLDRDMSARLEMRGGGFLRELARRMSVYGRLGSDAGGGTRKCHETPPKAYP